MDKKELTRNLAFIVIFTAVALIEFTDNVRTVQIIGLFACGMVVGSSLVSIIRSLKTKPKVN